MKKRFLAIILALLIALFGTVGCTDKRDGGNSTVEEVKGVEPYVPADTSVVLSDSGATDYVMVVPARSDTLVVQGKEELWEFFRRSTGAELNVVTDEGLVFDEQKKYISLGNTTIFNGTGLNLGEEYKEDGFVIKRFGNTVVIAGGSDYGVMYGVYGFLRYNLGVRFYANDEITVPDRSNGVTYLKDFDLSVIPDFDNRALGLTEHVSSVTEYRLGLEKGHGKNWLAWCHTYFQLLPKTKYIDDHPDWYSHNGQTQLCLTNEGMIAEMIDVIKERVLNATWLDNILLEVGHEDNSGFCDCTTCTAEINTYGSQSAVMMRFMNKLADALNPWMKETYHGQKTLKLVAFAYGPTVPAPVVRDENGEWQAADPSVIAHENVGIMLAPLGSDWAHSMYDAEHNSRTKEMFEGWPAVCDEFYIYTYNVVFDNHMYFMDHWSYVQEYYRAYKAIGAKFIFDQGASHMNMPFWELSNYVRSRLLWNVDADVEKLIDEFITAYYKAGAPYVKEYFDLVRTRYKLIERDLIGRGESYKQTSYVRTNSAIASEEYWPKDWLLNGIKIFDKAIEACASIEDETERENAVKRIKAERLSPIYILMTFYRTSLTSNDIQHYIDVFREDCELNAITHLDEHNTISVMKCLNDWSIQLKK